MALTKQHIGWITAISVVILIFCLWVPVSNLLQVAVMIGNNTITGLVLVMLLIISYPVVNSCVKSYECLKGT